MKSMMCAGERLIFVADRFTDDGIAKKTLESVKSGVDWVHLRDHAAEDTVFRDKAAGLVEVLREASPGIRVSINRRLHITQELKLHFHTGKKGPGIRETRALLTEDTLIGYSAHELGEAVAAQRNGADYVFFSPIFPTRSKRGHPGAGIKSLKSCCNAVEIPVYALGGITPVRVGEMFE